MGKDKKYQEIINEASNVNIDVNIDFARSLNLEIKNSETPTEEFNLFSSDNNTSIALSILKA